MLVALQETETALANYANELDRRSALQAARDQAANAARLSRLRVDAGADSILTVLDAERTRASADAQLAASDALVTTYQIALFKALAGGWSAARGFPLRSATRGLTPDEASANLRALIKTG